MATYLAPGVFIEEIERGPRPIEGVATSTAAFLGETERGPQKPRLVTSYNEYFRYFGGVFDDGKYMPYALSGFFDNGGQLAYVCRIVGQGGAASTRTVGGLAITAIGPGKWGDRIHVALVSSSMTKKNSSGSGTVPVGFRLQVSYWQNEAPGGSYPDPFDPAQNRILPRPTLVEDFDNLVWDDPSSPDYFVTRLDGASSLIEVSVPQPLNAVPSGSFGALSGGGDQTAAPSVNDYVGNAVSPADRTGLSALELDEYREVALVYAPNAASDVAMQVYQHCEDNKFRFAVIDCAMGMSDTGSIDPRANWDTSYGAYYYPWVVVADLRNGARKLVPPGGYVLGLYARTDSERGVWKAPANDVLQDVFDLEFHVNTQMQEVLNPRGVNAIRNFPGRGIRVWGARTLSSDSLWKYVSVRRLFIFLEHSIYDGTQWVVFEPNDERLWERVKDSLRLFLRTQWRSGALMGTTEDEAFKIACDRSTMTQDDILNGRLICEIAIAPVRPAEFVVFRIFQNTAEAQA